VLRKRVVLAIADPLRDEIRPVDVVQRDPGSLKALVYAPGKNGKLKLEAME
jgi:hypothetical protein